MNRLIRYFDLLSEARPKYAHAVAQGKKAPQLHWMPQYCTLLIGIIVQPFLQRYISGGAWNLQGLWGWVVAAIFLAIIAFPAVYKHIGPPQPTKTRASGVIPN